MAKPIPFHSQSKPLASNAERLQNATLQHAEALLSGYQVLQLFHDKGVLNLCRGLLGAGDEVVGMMAKAVDAPESIKGIRNFLLLTRLFASIPPDLLSGVIQAFSAGAEREKRHKPPGVLGLLWRLRNENSRRAAAVALDLVEGVGKGLLHP